MYWFVYSSLHVLVQADRALLMAGLGRAMNVLICACIASDQALVLNTMICFSDPMTRTCRCIFGYTSYVMYVLGLSTLADQSFTSAVHNEQFN